MSTAEAGTSPSLESDESAKKLKHKRRYCRHEGCTSIVKSQGLCQRHGAKPRMCKVDRCTKQAQGNFDGMCKSHFKMCKRTATPLPPPPPAHIAQDPPPPVGTSVYDRIIPDSVAWKPNSGVPMPLVKHLHDGFHDPNQPPAWHRNDERRARGLWPVSNPAMQLEGWERELVWMEILLLTGNPDASFRHLARGWGRDKGFHTVLASFVCARHGNADRKKRQKRRVKDHDNDDGDSDDDDDDDDDEQQVDLVGEAMFDDTLYGDAAYNEALAADLFTFEAAERQASSEQQQQQQRMLSFDDGAVVSEELNDTTTSTQASTTPDEPQQPNTTVAL